MLLLEKKCKMGKNCKKKNILPHKMKEVKAGKK